VPDNGAPSTRGEGLIEQEDGAKALAKDGGQDGDIRLFKTLNESVETWRIAPAESEYRKRRISAAAAKKWRTRVAERTGSYLKQSPTQKILDAMQERTCMSISSAFEEIGTHTWNMEHSKDAGHTLPDDDSWMSLLFNHRTSEINFKDPVFPANVSSLYHNGKTPAEGSGHDVGKNVASWRRIKDIFSVTKFVKLSICIRPSANDYQKLDGLEVADEASFLNAEDPGPLAKNGNAIRGYLNAAKNILSKAYNGSKKEFSETLTPHISAWFFPNGLHGSSKHYDAWFQLASSCSYFKMKEVQVRIMEQTEQHIDVVAKVTLGAPKIELFSDGTEAGDVRQGGLGDCYFLGALSIIANSQDRLMRIFPTIRKELQVTPSPLRYIACFGGTKTVFDQEYNAEGIYAVRFHRYGETRIVVVDDYLPCDSNGWPVYAQPPATSAEIWPLIVEKAYAKLNGSYEMIVGGDEAEALAELSGGVPYNQLSLQQITPADAERMIEDHSILVGASRKLKGTFSGLIGNHAYSVLKTVKIPRLDLHLVQLRNPWGEGGEWSAAWSDGDEKNWKKLTSAEKRRIGQANVNDGKFFMAVKDFERAFDTLFACAMLDNDKWTSHRVSSSWRGDSAGGRDAMHCNPQFQLTVGEDCDAYFYLRLPSRRPQGLNIDPASCKVHIFKKSIPHKRVVYFETSKVLNSDSPFQKGGFTEACCRLKKDDSPFAIVASAWDAGFEKEFFLEVHTNAPSTFEAFSKNKSLPVCDFCGKKLPRDRSEITVYVSGEVLHTHCIDAYNESKAEKCLQCNGPIQGKYYSIGEEGSVHEECYSAFNASRANKCLYCDSPILGSYYTIETEGQVHAECYTKFKALRADKCIKCGGPIIKIPGEFSGAYYNNDAGGKYHEECFGHDESHLVI
jgi:calpain